LVSLNELASSADSTCCGVLLRLFGNCYRHCTYGPASELPALLYLLAQAASVLCRVRDCQRLLSADLNSVSLLCSVVESQWQTILTGCDQYESALSVISSVVQLIGTLLPLSYDVIQRVDALLPLVCAWACSSTAHRMPDSRPTPPLALANVSVHALLSLAVSLEWSELLRWVGCGEVNPSEQSMDSTILDCVRFWSA
jgi:hypothetical protein